MKYLILLEGNSEKAFVEILIDKGIFSIDKDDMLDLKPHQKRKIDPYLLTLIRQLPPDEKVSIIKIGDKMTDKLKIPKEIKHKIHSQDKYCTKPEFEMLIIINEDLYNSFQKVKSSKKASTFTKENVTYNGKKYNKSQVWIREYFYDKDLKSILHKYKQISSHDKHEKYLVDLLK